MEVIFRLCPAKQWNLRNHEWNKWMKHVYLPLSVIFFYCSSKSWNQDHSTRVGRWGEGALSLPPQHHHQHHHHQQQQQQQQQQKSNPINFHKVSYKCISSWIFSVSNLVLRFASKSLKLYFSVKFYCYNLRAEEKEDVIKCRYGEAGLFRPVTCKIVPRIAMLILSGS